MVYIIFGHFSLDSFIGKSELTSALINQVQIAIKKMENIYSQHFSATYLCTTTVHNIHKYKCRKSEKSWIRIFKK